MLIPFTHLSPSRSSPWMGEYQHCDCASRGHSLVKLFGRGLGFRDMQHVSETARLRKAAESLALSDKRAARYQTLERGNCPRYYIANQQSIGTNASYGLITFNVYMLVSVYSVLMHSHVRNQYAASLGWLKFLADWFLDKFYKLMATLIANIRILSH